MIIIKSTLVKKRALATIISDILSNSNTFNSSNRYKLVSDRRLLLSLYNIDVELSSRFYTLQ